MTPLALIAILAVGQGPLSRDVEVKVTDDRFQTAMDIRHTTEAACGWRRYRVVEGGGPEHLSVTVDDEPQVIENEDAVRAMRAGRTAPVTQILCAPTSFRIVLGDPARPVGYAYGFIRR